MHLALWYVVLVCHQYDVCKSYIGNVYVGLSESVNCVQSTFLKLVKVRRVCCSLYTCRMLIVVIMGKWSHDHAC